MATPTKKQPKAAKAELNALLTLIASAGESGTYADADASRILQAEGLVEVNEGMVDTQGRIAVRVTQAGLDKAGVQSAPKAVHAFAIADDVPMPERARRGGRSDIYPFDSLKVGQSFFVPNSEEKPDVFKTLASTISSANARYAIPDPNGATRTNRKGKVVAVTSPGRLFRMDRVADGAAWGFPGQAGAGIWRKA